MNRIFKVIWSEARNAYVVVSELTKRQSKSCSTKKLLATLIAAGVFSMAGMHAPVTAAKIEEATRDNYIAIEATHFKEGDRLYINDGRKHVGDSVRISGYKYILTKIQISGDQDALYWVRDGYGLKVETDAKYFEGADTGLKVSPYKLKDSASTESTKGLVIRGLSGISDTKIKTAVNEDSLHLLSYDNYAGVSNSGGIETKRSYNYFILRNNEWEDVGLDYTPDGQNFSKNFQEVNYNKTTGYYEFNGKQVAFENVYNIDNKLGVFLTSPNGKEVYTGPVYGLHNEILITAYDENSKTWSTVWGGEMSDPNSTIGSMTVGQFNNILADIHNEDAILADADVVKTVVNGESSTINLQNKKGNLIPGITVTRTADQGSDTVVTIAEQGNANSKIDLVTGSRVSAETSDGNLTKLTINGVDYALSGVDTNTTYTISSEDGTGNVVKKYKITGSDSRIMEFVDTDTKYTAGTGITIDSNNGNQISIIPSAVANSVSIRYKANNEEAKSVSLSDGLKFVQGGSVQISTGENGVVNISGTDTNTQNTTVAGKNITVSADNQENGTIKYTVKTNDEVEFNKVTVGKTTGFNGVVISGSGINMNGQKVTGLAAGTENSDAVNVQQLNNASIKKFTVDSSNKSISLEKNNGTSIENSISFATKVDTDNDTVLTVGDGTTSFDLITGSRVSVAKNSADRLSSITVNGTSYDINDYQVKAGTYTVNNGSVTLDMQNNGVDINEKVVINGIVTSSEVAASKTEVKAGDNVTVTSTHGTDGQKIYTINAKDTTLDSANSSRTSAEDGMGFDYKIKDTDENEVTITDIASATKLRAVNSQVETNTSNITTNTNNITTNTNNITKNTQNITKNATEIAKGFSVSDGTNTKKFALGDTVNFNGTGAASVSVDATTGEVSINAIETTAGTNIAVQNVDGKYVVSTTDDVVFTSVTANTATIGGIGISNTGITMNNQKITGLAAGEADTDAVNLGQLKEYAATAGANTKVLAGKNISVESNTDGGKNEYTVNLDNNVTLGSDSDDGSLLGKSSVGNVLISNGQIIGDKYAITNDGGAIFADGVISAAGDGTFRAANGNFTVFADGTVDSKLGDDGRFLATSGGLSVTKGSSNFVVTGAGVSLSAGKNALVVNADGTAIAGGLNVLGSKITNVAAGVDDTDAVNVGQLRDAVAAGDTHIKSGVYQVGEVSLDEEGNKSQGVSIDVVDGSGSVTGKVKITDVAKASDLGDVSKLDADLKNSESNVTTVVDAVNNLNDKVGDLQYLNVAKGDIVNGDDTTTAIGKLNQALQNVSQKATAHNTVSNADTNITISESPNSDGGTNYALALNKQKINLGNVIIEGEKGSITAKNVTAGKTSIGDAGVQFDGKTYIGENGINANDQNITNVAAGELSETSKDAVNGSQLYATNQQVNQNTANINSLDNRISKLGSRVNKVGAGAAALAALHPMDFDPDDKLSFAVGMGNYAGQNAAAIGAFYRPNEKVMMSVGGTYGNDENMVNVGLSFALDRTNNVSNSRTAMAREIIELRSHVAKQDQQIAQLTALVNKLVGNDAVKGEGVQMFLKIIGPMSILMAWYKQAL